MQEITLHSRKYPGLVALVDDSDYTRVSTYRWRPAKSHNTFYAQADTYRADGKPTTVGMHSLLTGYRRTDHEDHNGLNNQRYNLRGATGQQNMANSSKRDARTSSRYKGVSWNTRHGKWYAQISINGKQRHLGCFADEAKASHAYDVAAIKAFGNFACTNF
jgi:hypothetical protein